MIPGLCKLLRGGLAVLAVIGAVTPSALAAEPWVVYTGHDGPGKGKKIVLISGDEEYRSEEALTQLGKILALRHGFQATVLFATDPATGIINPHVRNNIEGLDSLKTADLMVIMTRWRVLPPQQMQAVVDYVKSGRPVIGLRTATHAFAPPEEIHREVLQYLSKKQKDPAGAGPSPIRDEQWGALGHYGDGYIGPKKEWEGGFGRLVLGEQWVAHHGHHKHESTRGVLAPGGKNHPITRGIQDGDIWAPSDVYTVRLPLPGDSKPLVLGQVLKRRGAYDESDVFYGMRPDDGPPVAEKNDPMMPIAWTKSYQIPGGKKGRAFTTTMGASTDLVSAGVRRLIVNAVYWALGMEDKIPATGADVTLVGDYQPTQFMNHPAEYWRQKGLKPADFRLQ